ARPSAPRCSPASRSRSTPRSRSSSRWSATATPEHSRCSTWCGACSPCRATRRPTLPMRSLARSAMPMAASSARSRRRAFACAKAGSSDRPAHRAARREAPAAGAGGRRRRRLRARRTDEHLLSAAAERLLLELKGKLVELSAAPARESASDVVHALVGLGYSEKEALAAVKGLPAGIAVADGIRAALKTLAKS